VWYHSREWCMAVVSCFRILYPYDSSLAGSGKVDPACFCGGGRGSSVPELEDEHVLMATLPGDMFRSCPLWAFDFGLAAWNCGWTHAAFFCMPPLSFDSGLLFRCLGSA
jgi:hypothetical protein